MDKDDAWTLLKELQEAVEELKKATQSLHPKTREELFAALAAKDRGQ